MEKRLLQGLIIWSCLSIGFIFVHVWYEFSAWSGPELGSMLLWEMFYFFIFLFLIRISFYKKIPEILLTLLFFIIREYIKNPFYHDVWIRKMVLHQFMHPGNLLDKYRFFGFMGAIEIFLCVIPVILGLILLIVYCNKIWKNKIALRVGVKY